MAFCKDDTKQMQLEREPQTLEKKKVWTQIASRLNLVRETGLEPVRDYHTPLKRARLPIPPLSQISYRSLERQELL